jgi:chaperonin GroEL
MTHYLNENTQMQTDNLYSKEEARAKLVSGIRKCAQAVGVTMGTGGSNSIIEAIAEPGHLMTNDGISILEAIKLADPIEEMGRKILLEAVKRANKQSGDGSSTATVLTAAIIEEGLKHLQDASPMDIKRSLEACVAQIVESINQQKREVEIREVGAVAAISAEDESIGALIQEIYEQIGKDGLIYWDVSKTDRDSYSIGTGITVDGAGYATPYMCDATSTGQNTGQIRIQNPKILITKQKITTANDLGNIGALLNSKEIKDLVIFCEDFDPLVISDLVQTRIVRGFRFALVKMPVLWKDWWYEDLQQATGATLLDATLGLPLKSVKEEHLGTVSHIIITKSDTYLDGIKDVTEHIKSLEALGTDDAKVRIARLNTRTARYYVGAPSESALSYKRLKVEDAISAAYQALHGGVVAGGGSALVFVANTIGTASDSFGWRILKEALKAPARQIAANAGHPSMVIGDDYDNVHGFDTKSGEFVDMFEAKITDPAPVVLNAVRNAISVAATVLTADTVVVLPRQQEVQNGPSPIMM